MASPASAYQSSEVPTAEAAPPKDASALWVVALRDTALAASALALWAATADPAVAVEDGEVAQAPGDFRVAFAEELPAGLDDLDVQLVLLPLDTAGRDALVAASIGFSVFALRVELPVIRRVNEGLDPRESLGRILGDGGLRKGAIAGSATAAALFVLF